MRKPLIEGAHFTFDNVRIHDATIKTAGIHLECVYALNVPFMAIRNSSFSNCDVFDVFFTYSSGPASGNVTLSGNTFSNVVKIREPYGTRPVDDRTARNWLITGNFFGVEPNFGDMDGSVMCGNTGSASAAWKKAC